MKNYYFGGGIRRSFLTFGGVVPEIKKLDYEVPYVDPSRIYGVDSGGKVYQKNTSTEPQGLKNNHFLGSGDCDTNKFSENLTKIGSSKVESLPSNPISQRNLDLNINKNRNKYETLPCTRLHTSMQFNRNMNSSLPSTSLGISSINESMKNTKLDDLKNFITPIKPQDKQVEVYSKVVPNKTPRLNKTWRNYRINVQKKIGKAKFRNTFTIPKFLKNQEKIKNDNDIHIYQDKKELKELCLPTTILNPIIDEPQKLGVAKSLKEEFEMYRQCYKVYKEDTGVEEQLKNSTVQNFEQTKRKESHSMVKKIIFYLSKCLHLNKT
ncbi:Hypothetical protein SRAE_2000394400 [Strongyloides ratti]|uniref:Uncharacterized protein n=1 Tax=Strongyloides ratti TaxID=34506 RepID=A0A090MZP5_STRRB|nr:Hypothetical protein SRAE_2000394400 [Strongyloides ratti]CEF69294.1 Hypothetical protein SRAE_2000394400 [Strongyloides ratti]